MNTVSKTLVSAVAYRCASGRYRYIGTFADGSKEQLRMGWNLYQSVAQVAWNYRKAIGEFRFSRKSGFVPLGSGDRRVHVVTVKIEEAK